VVLQLLLAGVLVVVAAVQGLVAQHFLVALERLVKAMLVVQIMAAHRIEVVVVAVQTLRVRQAVAQATALVEMAHPILFLARLSLMQGVEVAVLIHLLLHQQQGEQGVVAHQQVNPLLQALQEPQIQAVVVVVALTWVQVAQAVRALSSFLTLALNVAQAEP
jgi:hypothetical protein